MWVGFVTDIFSKMIFSTMDSGKPNLPTREFQSLCISFAVNTKFVWCELVYRCSHKNILTMSAVVECCWFYGKRFLMFGFRLRLRPGATPRGNPLTDASIEMDNRERRRLIRPLKAPTQYVVAHRLCLIAVCVDCFIVYCWTYLYVQRLQDCWYLILYTNVVFPICWCYAD